MNVDLEGATLESPSNFAGIRLDSVRIANFRGITECRVDFEPDLTVLVGINNAGKSRILRALVVSLSAQRTEADDLSSANSEDATIDVVFAPWPIADADTFDERVGRRLGNLVQRVSSEPTRERAAWRTVVRPSQEGFGARDAHVALFWDAPSQTWRPVEPERRVSNDQRDVVASMLIETRRDIAEEMNQRGSAVRRLLDDLEVDPEMRDQLETQLNELSNQIVDSSEVLQSMIESLTGLRTSVSSVGSPDVSALPSRLENLSQSIAIQFDTGQGQVPMRMHGAGSRSLTSLQVQNLMYQRRLGKDGPALRPHPITLIEEPEAHLHPQAHFEIPELLSSIIGQKVLTTHSAHVVTAVEPRAVRLLRPFQDGRIEIRHLVPSTLGAARVSTGLTSDEVDRLKRTVERPFGELLFATAVVLGDGATERTFLPPFIRQGLGMAAHGVTVIDPGSLNQPTSIAVLKFAQALDLPWVVLCDPDTQGIRAREDLLALVGEQYRDRFIVLEGEEDGASVDGIEDMLAAFDQALCEEACVPLGFVQGGTETVRAFMVRIKPRFAGSAAAEITAKYPFSGDVATCGWPKTIRRLLESLLSQMTAPDGDPS